LWFVCPEQWSEGWCPLMTGGAVAVVCEPSRKWIKDRATGGNVGAKRSVPDPNRRGLNRGAPAAR
jgi:hypothetical protein